MHTRLFITGLICSLMFLSASAQTMSIEERAAKLSDAYQSCKKLHKDSIEECRDLFFAYFPEDYNTFYELYESRNAPLYQESYKHVDILSDFPKDAFLYKRLILVSINGKIYDEAVNLLRVEVRHSFLEDMKAFSKVLNDFDFESIVSVFHYLEENVDEMHQIKTHDLEPIKKAYPKVYKAFIHSKK